MSLTGRTPCSLVVVGLAAAAVGNRVPGKPLDVPYVP
jgi:hypothetical protein